MACARGGWRRSALAHWHSVCTFVLTARVTHVHHSYILSLAATLNLHLLTLPALQAEVGSKIKFGRVLAAKSAGKLTVGKPYMEGVTVEAEVLEELRGEKVGALDACLRSFMQWCYLADAVLILAWSGISIDEKGQKHGGLAYVARLYCTFVLHDGASSCRPAALQRTNAHCMLTSCCFTASIAPETALSC